MIIDFNVFTKFQTLFPSPGFSPPGDESVFPLQYENIQRFHKNSAQGNDHVYLTGQRSAVCTHADIILSSLDTSMDDIYNIQKKAPSSGTHTKSTNNISFFFFFF